jgi:hypothetical protein
MRFGSGPRAASPAMRFGRAAVYCDQVFRKFVGVNPVRRRNADEI